MPVRSGTTKVLVYDTADKTKPVLSREVELEGNYLSSRKVGSSVYLIANRFLDLYSIQQEQGEQPAPLFRDSAVSSQWESVGYDRIRYFPDSLKNSYLMVAGFDLDRPDQKADVQSYLGSGQNVYASADHLYVAVSPYGGPVRILPMVKRPASSSPASPSAEQPPVPEQTTSLYKFRLDQGSLRFAGTGKVPGSVLNQFSMDERDGYFRIATTKGDMWAQGEQTSKNNVYVLDESLTVTGKLEDLAPGERIYSVRFLGNRAYMVTFRKVDPLFAIDLSDPQSPKVLGSLKIPGYSDYLHPYDETHLIGFGKDTIEAAVENPFPGQDSTQAFYQGMKLAMFDVSDVAHPVELFKEAIGDRGTDSELLHNHKALLFSKEKNLMAFPVTVAKINPKQTPNQPAGFPAYGEFAYQGAYVYGIDLQKGFTLKGKITHLTEEDIAKAGQGGGEWNKYINRILYSGTNLYTFSPSEIRSNDMGSLQPNGSLKLPAAVMPETGIPID
ncbi:beta-propeller domain-containing protein [Paenibacillus sp. CC-CFT747]|nr:beta-propeller domain-containing protein [Paenibacillus sp. CC-CFT747]